MTPADFRHVALGLPEASESSHMGHPDFRVGGRIFATLIGDDESVGMVKLTPPQQARLVDEAPHVYSPAQGGWGRRGATLIRLAAADEESVRRALVAAWRTIAPKRLVRLHAAG